MEWLHDLPEGEQEQVIDLAVKRREMQKDCKDQVEQRCELRRYNMIQAHIHRKVLKEKARQERESLSQLHLTITPEELHEEIAAIDKKGWSTAKKKKKEKKRSLIKEQVKIRKKGLGQRFILCLVI